MSNRVRGFLLGLTLLTSSALAFAEAGDLDAVVRHCGAPGAEDKRTSQVTNQLERTLIYHDALYLHFEPVSGGWSFVSAWNGHLPMSRNELEERLPCFHNALQESATAAAGTPAIDPAIAAQTIHRPANDATFGIPHFALIVFLVITLLVFIILPSARQRKLAKQQSKPVDHIYRKPNLEEYTSSTSVPIAEPIEYRRPDLVEVVQTPLAAEPIGYRKVAVVEAVPTASAVAERIEYRKTEIVEVVHTKAVVEPVEYRKAEHDEYLFSPRPAEAIQPEDE